jgi:hypothetical protein
MLILYDEMCNELYTLANDILYQSNFDLQKDLIKLLTRLLRYGDNKIRNNVMNLSENIINSTNFYVRRLYFVFFEECFNVLSTKFLFEKKIVNNLFKLLNDSCPLNVIHFFKFIPKFYFFLKDEMNLKFLIDSKIHNLKSSNSKDAELLSVYLY